MTERPRSPNFSWGQPTLLAQRLLSLGLDQPAVTLTFAVHPGQQPPFWRFDQVILDILTI